MPFYEGISSMGFINEKHTTVVIDFGNVLTKIGFAGENSPRAIIKSEVKCRQTLRNIPVFTYQSNDELLDHLVDFIYTIYFKFLLVNPKDRRVVIVENILGPTVVKKTLADVLFKHYEVLSLLFIPSHLVALMTLGISTGLVLDIGHEEATVIPIYEGIPILNAWKASPLGSKAIQESLKESLLDRGLCQEGSSGEEVRLSSVNVELHEHILEDIKVRCCFASTISRGKILQKNKYDRSVEPPAPPQSIKYNLKGTHILNIPGTIYENACEVLFEVDEDKISIPAIVIDCIMQCPVDTRKNLSENLVIIGGIASIIGMKHRILSELQEIVASANNQLKLYSFKIHVPPITDNCVAWLGGSLYGCTEATPLHSTSKESYIESGNIYDWCNLSYNMSNESISF